MECTCDCVKGRKNGIFGWIGPPFVGIKYKKESFLNACIRSLFLYTHTPAHRPWHRIIPPFPYPPNFFPYNVTSNLRRANETGKEIPGTEMEMKLGVKVKREKRGYNNRTGTVGTSTHTHKREEHNECSLGEWRKLLSCCILKEIRKQPPKQGSTNSWQPAASTRHLRETLQHNQINALVDNSLFYQYKYFQWR